MKGKLGVFSAEGSVVDLRVLFFFGGKRKTWFARNEDHQTKRLVRIEPAPIRKRGKNSVLASNCYWKSLERIRMGLEKECTDRHPNKL